jgi:hypothetical protein
MQKAEKSTMREREQPDGQRRFQCLFLLSYKPKDETVLKIEKKKVIRRARRVPKGAYSEELDRKQSQLSIRQILKRFERVLHPSKKRKGPKKKEVTCIDDDGSGSERVVRRIIVRIDRVVDRAITFVLDFVDLASINERNRNKSTDTTQQHMAYFILSRF